MLYVLQKSEELQKLIDENKNRPLLVDFYADWCPPCKMLVPVLQNIETKYGDEFAIVKVNVDTFPDLGAQYQIKSIPTLYFYWNKEVVEHSAGFKDENTLVHKLRGLVK